MKTHHAFFSVMLALVSGAAPSRGAIEEVCLCRDPKMTAEHQAMMDLLPIASATVTAVRSGNWSDPTVWSTGAIPAAGAKVYISNNFDIVYDRNDATTVLMWIRNEGRLSFSTTADTRLVVETLANMSIGTLTMGTLASPIESRRCLIEFVDNGSITRALDPKKLSRGFITLGSTTIVGQRKTPFTRLSIAPAAGATQITLEKAPLNWAVGDTLIIAGTHIPGRDNNTWSPQDERRTITAINGLVVTLNQALTLKHDSPDITRFKPYVANLTRSIDFSTKGGTAVPIQQRGHFMVMHVPRVDIENASFTNLGRTDKNKWVDDPGTDPVSTNGGQPQTGFVDTAEGANPRGRYSLHLHRTGVTDQLSNPAVVRGCVVDGSPGWGFASHESNSIIEDCVSYNVFGAGFVTEIGNEQGAMRRNLAMNGRGNRSRHFKEGTGNHDLAFNGIGFWFQGRNVVVEDNVATSQNEAGYFWFHRSDVENPDIPLETLRFPKQHNRNFEPLADGRPATSIDSITLRGLRDNLSFASTHLLMVVKAGPDQGHDQRSMFGRFTGWNIEVATNIEYTAFYTFHDWVLVRDGVQNPNSGQWETPGMGLGNNSSDFTLVDVNLSGWRADTALNAPAHPGNTDGWFEYTRLDVLRGNLPMQNGHLFVTIADENNGNRISTYNPAYHFFYSTSNPSAPVTFTPDANQTFKAPASLGWGPSTSFILRGIKSDSLGSMRTEALWRGDNLALRIDREGVFTGTGSRFFLVLEDSFNDRVDNRAAPYRFALDVTAHVNGGTRRRGALPADLNTLFPNRAPFPSADAYTVAANGRLDVARNAGVLINDSDPDGDLLRVEHSLTSRPLHGSLSLNPNGSFTYFPDPGYTGSDQFTYVLNDGTTEAAPATVTITIGGIVPSAFDAWRSANFSPAQLADPLVSDELADPDRDGVNNLFEYAQSSNPLSVASAARPIDGKMTLGGNTYLTLQYTKNKTATDAVCIAQVSFDLVNWQDGPAVTTTVSTTDNGATQTILERSLAPATPGTARAFMRLRVTR